MLEENPVSHGHGGRMLAGRRGFSLVELLVVVVIFGVVSTVILDLYVNVVRTTASSEEVVEVQQGMRIALDQMADDIQMAGFLLPTDPITVARNDLLTIETATAFGAFARIPTAFTFLASDVNRVIPVGNTAMANLFHLDNYVRIISPLDGCQSAAVALCDCGGTPAAWCDCTGGAACGDRVGAAPLFQIDLEPAATATSLRLRPVSALTADVPVLSESMIVRVPSPADDPPLTYPNVITYTLEDDLNSTNPAMMVLSRNWAADLSADARTIATNITALRLEYVMDDGTVQPSPTAAAGTALTAAQRANIVAVRIFLTGQTENAKAGENKTRELQTTVKIRNI